MKDGGGGERGIGERKRGEKWGERKRVRQGDAGREGGRERRERGREIEKEWVDRGRALVREMGGCWELGGEFLSGIK